ncbi:hypothetical protein HPB48_020807 [Haemaphysalis longicornis]|uniref:Uncharacterized protein n=1 Tax=Haemaphysalis longicornis TaxID=44386 RepID=A0A9J6GRD3_HAELO|nr:hypothetical protein HPB48_020807 [Haemaphysalis longicornis]
MAEHDNFPLTGAPTFWQVTNLTDLVEKMVRVGGEQLREIDSDVESYTRKVINGIYELRRTTDELVRGAFQDTVEQGNRTRVLVREEFRKLHEQIEPLPLIEPRLSFLSEGLERRIEEEVQLYDLLERIILEMRNRSQGDTKRISDELQGHSHEVAALLRGAVSAVFAAGNNTLAEVRKLLLTGNHSHPEWCGKQPPCAKPSPREAVAVGNHSATSVKPLSASVTTPLQSPSTPPSVQADDARTRADGTATSDYEYYDDTLK